MAKIIIFGSQGLIGYDLFQTLKGLHEVKALTRKKLDFTNTRQVSRLLEQDDWDVVIDAAGLSDPEVCESEPKKAFFLNADTPGEIARLCRLRKIKFVYFSDALVFDGDNTRPYREDDTPNPLSIYGHSKRNGELIVMKNNPNHLVIRTSWLYGFKMKNIFRKICELYEERDEMKVVEDYYGTPCWAKDIATAVHSLIETDASGIYHVSSGGLCSWFDYTKKILDVQFPGGDLSRLKAISGQEISLKSKRPRNSTLDTGKLFYQVNYDLPHWEDGLERFFSEVAVQSAGTAGG